MDAAERAEALRAHASAAADCTGCALAATRGAVVVGAGSPDAALLLVGDVPGFREERAGTPFAGSGGAVLAALLERIGLAPEDVYVTTVVKCRPPGGRDPLAEELAACEPHLFRQIELVRPRVVVTLGTLATRLLTGRPHDITRVHGEPQRVTVGALELTVLPLYHPAAARYTPAMLEVLERDVSRIPVLLGEMSAASVACQQEPQPEPEPDLDAASPRRAVREGELVQLGLF